MHFTPMPVKSADDIHHICLHNTIDFFLPRFCLKKIRGITITCVYSKITVQSVACYRSGDEVVVWYLHRNAIPGASILYLNGGKGKKEVGKCFFPSSVLLLTEWSSRLFRSSELLLSLRSCATKQRKMLSVEAEGEDQRRTTDRLSQSNLGNPETCLELQNEFEEQYPVCSVCSRREGKRKGKVVPVPKPCYPTTEQRKRRPVWKKTVLKNTDFAGIKE